MTTKNKDVIVGDNSDLSIEEQKKLAKREYMREYMRKYVKEKKLKDPEFIKKRNQIHANYMKKRCEADPEYHKEVKKYHKDRYNTFKDAYEKLKELNLGEN